MEMASELAHSMFKYASSFSLIFYGRGDVLALANPFNKRTLGKRRENPWRWNAPIFKMSYLRCRKKLILLTLCKRK